MATQIDLGAVVPIGKGDWNPSTTYERANIVRHNSVAWICKVATSLGVEPTEDSSDWYLLAKDTSSVTSINGMRGDVTIDSVLENPSIDDNSLKIASTAWINTKISQVAGLPLGHIYLWPFSTPPDGSIQLNGSTYSRELYSDLWNLIQEKGWYKPEAEWQSIASANGGYCPWYSDGDGSTTFRVPKFASYQKLALASSDAGKYYKAGLPNITGSLTVVGENSESSWVSNTRGQGAFYDDVVNSKTQYFAQCKSNNGKTSRQKFDASKSNPIYGRSDTVQPESNDWIVCVVAFGKATNVGSVDVANVMSAVNQTQSEINQVQSKINQTQSEINQVQSNVNQVQSEIDQVQSKIKMILPVGSVIASATNTAPDGYLICNGAAISRTTYAALFKAIGTIYGKGNGSTTFNLPNLVNRFIQGSGTSGTVLNAGLPNITGFLGDKYASIGSFYDASGAFKARETGKRFDRGPDNNPSKMNIDFNASWSNSIYGKSSTVQPPALTMRYYIKY